MDNDEQRDYEEERYWRNFRPEEDPEEAEMALVRAQDALQRAIEDRCTCTDRDATLPPLAGHEPDCSLQNTGWLS